MGVTIRDVAVEAGVSPATVSSVLSGQRSTSSDARSKVLSAVDKLGYVPSRTAQNLALGQTNVIGLIIPELANPFFAELAQNVERAADAAGISVIVSSAGFDRAKEIYYWEMISSRQVDGIIYTAGTVFGQAEMEKMRSGLPTVLLDEEVTASDQPLVTSDNHAGGLLVAEHLFELGHRNVIVVAEAGGLPTAQRRLDGFAARWAVEEGTKIHRAAAPFSIDGGERVGHSLVEVIRDSGATAVFATNDLMAIGLIRALKEHGLRVPEDVSIVGYDDSLVASLTTPGLTTVHQDVGALAKKAVELLLGYRDNARLPLGKQIVLPVTLRVRESTASIAPAQR